MSERKFLVSVVTAVYNTEDYIEEAIQSIINQTIGFEKNIQLILVNDGSSDRSGAICRRYARLYPDNIIYKKTRNHGVAEARNFGLKYATGRWVNFMDSDDKWGRYAFSEMQAFIEEHPDIKVVAPRMKFFDARKDYHMLDYKFFETRVVDIEQEPSSIQLHGAQCWYHRSAIKNHRFDPLTKIGEDAKFFSDAMMQYGEYGVVRDARYYYRKRRTQVNYSLVQSQRSSSYYYNECFGSYFGYFLKKYSAGAHLSRYMQYLFAYELRWRLWEPVDEEICPELEAYQKRLKKLIDAIDDEVIMTLPGLKSEQRFYMLKLKHGYAPDVEVENGNICYGGLKLSNFRKRALRMDCLEYRNGKLHIFGRLFSFLSAERLRLYVEENHVRKEISLGDNPNSRLLSFKGDVCLEARIFECWLPVNTKTVSFVCEIDGKYEIRTMIGLGTFSKLNWYESSFYYSNGRIARLSKSKMSLLCCRASITRLMYREFRYQCTMARRRKFRLMLYRDAYWVARLFNKKRIWVVSDRADMANDNGEAMFRYICKQKPAGVDYYFRIERKSQDYDRMKSIGKILRYNSVRAKLKIMLADKIISSHIDNFVFRPFPKKDDKWMSNLYDYDIVFLQHGIIKDDLSRWLIRYAKNMRFFATSTKAEYESIINGNYLYSKDQVKLTGLARHDRLSGKKPQKLIIVIPTWRKDITGSYDLQDGVRQYNKNFSKSEYYLFYNKLINDKRIIAAMKKRGYRGLFATHPNHLANAGDFQTNDVFDVSLRPIDYSELFANGALMITDYSSVAFEFAYLNKPVIYTQFDREHFFKNHVYTEGYFSYEDNGFGPVCYDYDSTVAAVLAAIEQDCEQPKKYAKRVSETFARRDGKSCERIYKAIESLGKAH